MIRVGLFIDTYFPMVDGVINVVHNYAKRMNDEEFEVVVFCPVDKKDYKDEFSYRVVRCKSMKVSFLDYTVPTPRLDRQFKKIVKESNLDVVHIHSPFGVAKMGVKYAKKHDIPVVATLHSQFKKDFYRATKSKLITRIMLNSVMNVFNRCDEYYAVNGRVAEIFHEYGTKHLSPVQRNATDFVPVADREKAVKLANERFSLAPDQTVFLYVGRINSLKNIYFTVEALSKLKDKNFKMFFVGDGNDMPTLQSKIKQFGLTDNVIL
ncbi:MAG: glycosyltransferase, partial [Clostridia bacterium]|nr:glycosyltransferase [Clostridia bacterium]